VSKKPIIGITKPDKGGVTQNLAIRFAVWWAGGRGVSITPKSFSNNLKLDGLIVAGGTDVHPTMYESEKIKDLYKYDEKRDQMESLLIREGLEKNLPMLCICRGAQLLNIISGGNLHSDVSKVYENASYPSSLWAKVFFRKKVILRNESKLFKIFKTPEMMVNSMHTQAVNKVGEGLLISSVEENGVVQSIEHIEKDFVLGVQFHPEFLPARSGVKTLFKELIERSLKFKN
jgi:putative glutamine amidotransferase